jgi:hypothetical protein
MGTMDKQQVTIEPDKAEVDLGLMFANSGTLIWIVEGHVSAKLELAQVWEEGRTATVCSLDESSIGKPLSVSVGSYVATCTIDGVIQHERVTVTPGGRQVLRFRQAGSNLLINIHNPFAQTGDMFRWKLRSGRGLTLAENITPWVGSGKELTLALHVPTTELTRCFANASDSSGSGKARFDLRPGLTTTVEIMMQRDELRHGESVTIKFHGLVDEARFWIYGYYRLQQASHLEVTPGTPTNSVVQLAPGNYQLVLMHGTSVKEHPFVVSTGGSNAIEIDAAR